MTIRLGTTGISFLDHVNKRKLEGDSLNLRLGDLMFPVTDVDVDL